MKKLIIPLIILFLFISCKDDTIFIKRYVDTKEAIKVKSLSFETDNYYLLDKVERSFKKFGFKVDDKDKQRYHIKLSSHYVINCANPVVHAVGADFSGYIRLSLFDNKKEIYRIQKDFRSKVTDDMIDMIVQRLIKDMRLSSSK